jgi:predicted transcriptional regulator
MLGELLGSTNKERVLIYLVAREKGYAREITRFYDTPRNPIQKALDGLERAGVLVSRAVGTIREYEFNPRVVHETFSRRCASDDTGPHLVRDFRRRYTVPGV